MDNITIAKKLEAGMQITKQAKRSANYTTLTTDQQKEHKDWNYFSSMFQIQSLIVMADTNSSHQIWDPEASDSSRKHNRSLMTTILCPRA